MRFPTLLRLALTVGLASVTLAAFAQVDVQELADRWTEAYNKHDRAALSAVYTQNANLMMHGAATIAGRGSIEEFWAGDFEEGDPLTLLAVTHSVEGSDMTLVHGDYQVINREDGGQLGAGRFAHIWTRNERGDWLLDRDMWNEPFEPYESMVRVDSDVQALADRWTRAYNRHDRLGLASLYTHNAYLMMHGAPNIVGRGDIGTFWAADFQEGNPLTLLSVTHAVEGIDMILVHGNYQVIDRGDGSRLGFGRFAHIWTGDRRNNWRLDRDLWYERSEPAP